MRVLSKRRIQLRGKPKWQHSQPKPALHPLFIEIPHTLKLASLTLDFEEKGFLVLRTLAGMYLQKGADPWRRGNPPSRPDIDTIIQTLQTRGLDGHNIRTSPEEYNELPVSADQPDQGPPSVS